MLDTLAEKAACDSKKKKKGYAAEAVVNTPECEKKPEEEKDMRGYYAKINVIKNKLRSMGAKNAMLLADPDEVEKCWDKGKKDIKEDETKNWPGAKPGEKNSQYNKDGTKKEVTKEGLVDSAKEIGKKIINTVKTKAKEHYYSRPAVERDLQGNKIINGKNEQLKKLPQETQKRYEKSTQNK